MHESGTCYTHTLCVYNYTYIIYAYVLETFSQLSESTHGLCFTIYSFSVSGIVPVSSVQLQVCRAVGASLSIIYHMYDTSIQSSNMSMASSNPLDAPQCRHVLLTGAYLLCSPGLSPWGWEM